MLHGQCVKIKAASPRFLFIFTSHGLAGTVADHFLGLIPSSPAYPRWAPKWARQTRAPAPPARPPMFKLELAVANSPETSTFCTMWDENGRVQAKPALCGTG